MALYASPNSPGDWKSFTRRNDISKLSLTEQRKKYLQETLQFEDFMAQQAYLQSMSLNSQTNQLHQGGNSDNKVNTNHNNTHMLHNQLNTDTNNEKTSIDHINIDMNTNGGCQRCFKDISCYFCLIC